MEKRHDTTLDVTFDADEWSDRLQAGSNNAPGGKGYVAIVRDLGPANGRYRRPVQIFDSANEHGPIGIFEKHLDATAYAERWREAKLALEERIHVLRVRRGIGLSRRMRDLALERGELDRQAKAVSRAKKENEDKQSRLIREANDPIVEIDLHPNSDTWALYDAPSETDGTLGENHRQLVLEHTGLEPILPVATGAKNDDPPPPVALHIAKGEDAGTAVEDLEEDRNGRKLPSSVVDAAGKRVNLGSWVEWDKSGDASGGFLVEIRGFLQGGGHSVLVLPFYCGKHGEWSCGGVKSAVVLASTSIRKARKPSAVKRPEWKTGEMQVESETLGEPVVEPFLDEDEIGERPGLNPADVVWPEGEESGEVGDE